MPKTKDGGYLLHEPDAAAGPYAPKAKEEEKKSGETVEVEITRGMTSERIARTLEKAGVIESASDYDSWLKKNRYSNKLHVGTFTLTKGMSYEDITKELTTKGY